MLLFKYHFFFFFNISLVFSLQLHSMFRRTNSPTYWSSGYIKWINRTVKRKKHFYCCQSRRFKTNRKQQHHPIQMPEQWVQKTSPQWQAGYSSPLQGKGQVKHREYMCWEFDIFTYLPENTSVFTAGAAGTQELQVTTLPPVLESLNKWTFV